METKNLTPDFKISKNPLKGNNNPLVYILADSNRDQLVLGITTHLNILKQYTEVSARLNPRYGKPAIDRLVYLRSFTNPELAGQWLLELNQYTRMQKERIIVSKNRNWVNLWNEPCLREYLPLSMTRPKIRYRSRFQSKRNSYNLAERISESLPLRSSEKLLTDLFPSSFDLNLRNKENLDSEFSYFSSSKNWKANRINKLSMQTDLFGNSTSESTLFKNEFSGKSKRNFNQMNRKSKSLILVEGPLLF